jgi:hypothetical protein
MKKRKRRSDGFEGGIALTLFPDLLIERCPSSLIEEASNAQLGQNKTSQNKTSQNKKRLFARIGSGTL